MNLGFESRNCHHLCDVTLFALRSLERALRYFHPLLVSEIQDRIIPVRQKLAEAYADSERLNAVSLEEGSRLRLKKSAGLLLRALDLFSEQDDLQRIVFNAMRAGRIYAQVQEILFSLKEELVPVHLFFLEEELQNRRGVPMRDQAPQGDELLHEGFDADPYARGGCSYYLPPGSVQDQALPLVVALHGGGGHGRDFIWFWLKEARSRRLLLMAPTSVGETWTISRTQEEIDSITEHIERFSARANIDRERMLLTGISDGATFCLACSLLESTPFRAFSPICGVLPPLDTSAVHGRRILWIHGKHDWMFPVQRAQEGVQRLKTAQADIILTICADLAHAYPREQNARILTWFLPDLALGRPR